jgi:hypothetical protein
MAGLVARDTTNGASLFVASRRAIPFAPRDLGSSSNAASSPFDTPPSASNRISNQTCVVELEEFDTMEGLCARWAEISPGDHKPRKPNVEDGIFICSLGGKSKQCTVAEVKAFCVGTRGWGSAITDTRRDIENNVKPNGTKVKRVYVGYNGTTPKFFLRYTSVNI